MKPETKITLALLAFGCSISAVFAQSNAQTNLQTETPPRDSPYERTNAKQKKALEYDHTREADVFFERKIWRVIDVREKMNKSFVYPNAPLYSIITDAAKNKELRLYSTATGDNFQQVLADDDPALVGTKDTITVYQPDDAGDGTTVVQNDINYEDIKRFRIKEVWFFDKESATLQCRIMGIAPIREVKDDKDNFKFEQPMFWAYYPTLRKVLAKHEAFNPHNDAQRMTWEDVFEMRLFSSYITKESNIYDRRIEDYKQGTDALLEGDNIKNTVFNFEHDLWSF